MILRSYSFWKAVPALCLYPPIFLSPAVTFQYLLLFFFKLKLHSCIASFLFLFECKVLPLNNPLSTGFPHMHPQPHCSPKTCNVSGLWVCLVSLLHTYWLLIQLQMLGQLYRSLLETFRASDISWIQPYWWSFLPLLVILSHICSDLLSPSPLLSVELFPLLPVPCFPVSSLFWWSSSLADSWERKCKR